MEIISKKSFTIHSDNQQSQLKNEEMTDGCCVCSDDNGYEHNAIVYCDGSGCCVAVHQGCYGIIDIPEGSWFCSACAFKLQIWKKGQKNEKIVNRIFLRFLSILKIKRRI
jgi:hypothetical protein